METMIITLSISILILLNVYLIIRTITKDDKIKSLEGELDALSDEVNLYRIYQINRMGSELGNVSRMDLTQQEEKKSAFEFDFLKG